MFLLILKSSLPLQKPTKDNNMIVEGNSVERSIMETEHEMSNILTSDNRTTTEMQVVQQRLQQHHGTLAPSLPGYSILARTDDGQTH